MGQEGRTPEKSILTVGDEMWIFFSSQKKKIRKRLSIKKAAGKIETLKYVVGMLLFFTSQISTGKNVM